MGGVLAELLVREGHAVTLVTPAVEVSTWMRMTMEQQFVQARLLELGVAIVTSKVLAAIRRDGIDVACAFTGRPGRVEGESLVLVTARLPDNRLATALRDRRAEWADAGIAAVTAIGDALAPGTIAAAVYAGRRFAEELGARSAGDGVPFRREVAGLAAFEGPWRPESRVRQFETTALPKSDSLDGHGILAVSAAYSSHAWNHSRRPKRLFDNPVPGLDCEASRTYGEVMDAWRTSCPRLSIWEDAVIDGLVRLGEGSGRQRRVVLTERGRRLLMALPRPRSRRRIGFARGRDSQQQVDGNSARPTLNLRCLRIERSAAGRATRQEIRA